MTHSSPSLDHLTAMARAAGLTARPRPAVGPHRHSRISVATGITIGTGTTAGQSAAEAAFLAFLRECASHQVGVDWSCPPAADLAGPALHHLPPPAAPHHAKAPDPHGTWRQRHRYGLCHFRRGPGFVSVKDSRAPDATAHFTLDDPDLRTVFLHALTPWPAHHLTSRQREAARLLVHENLLWQSPGGHLVTLPTRMLRWPIPATAV
ncbi:hypothetical protein JQK87_04175 [Streptomyces sp. G44]|uniref:DUF5825 family protein n=1 Tax=Streptomyces sp. G44 TaxID=2807632 RepID=UPI001961E140|nr:DUF5825 family protein [Streptomyces sp. G44]MBM7167614.1 hypothetical protein [Streptomyces sp. G44]